MKIEGITNKILIADDDRTNRLFLKKGVSGLPYEFVFAESGTEALEKILEEDFDLLLLDILMPGLTGFEVIKKFKEHRPDRKIPFIFLTGQSESDSISEGFSLGAVDYITKPFTLIEIRLRIKTHHDLYKSQFELNSYAKNMESLAKERAEQLIHSDRLATLGSMSAGIMHEINNPTTFISGNVQLMQDKFFRLIKEILEESPRANETKIKFMLDELPEMFDGINHGVSRIKKITDGLKAFSRTSHHSEKSIPIDLRDSVKNALRFTKSSIPHKILVNYQEPDEPYIAMASTQEIEQVLINLIVNSSHAIEEIDSPNIFITLSKDLDKTICKISDNGPGIPDEILKKIWNPFFTTKPAGKGTGLGLAICREIIQSHSGSLVYTGALEKGAEFTMTLKGE
ncbi:MAG: response regulator [Lentisphaerales bacterium]|nr:response regulator [Lentisphaerales bacterium]